MRRALAIAATASLLSAAPAVAAPVDLQGTMTISTSTPGSVLVHIPVKTPTFPDANGKGDVNFRFSGASALRVLVLLAEAPGTDGKRFAGYVDGSSDVPEGTWTATDMPPGDYRLYALTDGHPVTITITMPTGSADAALSLPDPAATDIHTMKAGGGGVFRASGATTGAGVFFGEAETTFSAGQAGTVEFCDALGDSADTDAPYSVGCSQGAVSAAVGAAGFETISAATVIEMPAPARHGFGGNAQALTPPAIRGAAGALTFTPPGVPGQSSSPVAPAGAVAARVVGTKVRVSKTGRAPVRVRCAGPGACHVRLAVSGSPSKKGKATIAAGATKKVNVRLSASLRKRLKRSRSIKVTLVLQVTGDSGTGTTLTRRRITFTAPRR